MSKFDAWQDLMDKTVSKNSNCKVKTLSVGGGLTLLKSLVGALPITLCLFFKALLGILKKLEALHNNFFVGVSWMKRN